MVLNGTRQPGADRGCLPASNPGRDPRSSRHRSGREDMRTRRCDMAFREAAVGRVEN